MVNVIMFCIKLLVGGIVFGLATTLCCTPMVPVVNWCEKKQFSAKGSKAYWTWAWVVIAIFAITLISGIVLSVIAMNTNTMKGVFDAIAVGVASMC